MKKLIVKLYYNHIVRYIFFGGLTTGVNLGVYYLLRLSIHMDLVAANVISVITAIIFAYFVNSRFVFETQAITWKDHWYEFIKFVTARISTMIIEVGGVWFMADVIHINDMYGKIIIQFVVLALNYVFSKFLVFVHK